MCLKLIQKISFFKPTLTFQSKISPQKSSFKIAISGLEYADDAGLLDDNVTNASARVTALSIGSKQDAAMVISIPKTIESAL